MSVFGGHVDISVANDDGEYDEQLDRERIDQSRVENLRFKCLYFIKINKINPLLWLKRKQRIVNHNNF